MASCLRQTEFASLASLKLVISMLDALKTDVRDLKLDVCTLLPHKPPEAQAGLLQAGAAPGVDAPAAQSVKMGLVGAHVGAGVKPQGNGQRWQEARGGQGLDLDSQQQTPAHGSRSTSQLLSPQKGLVLLSLPSLSSSCLSSPPHLTRTLPVAAL